MATDNHKPQQSEKDCKPKVDKKTLEALREKKEKQLLNNETVKKDGKDCNS